MEKVWTLLSTRVWQYKMTALPSIFDLVFDIKTEEQLQEKYVRVKEEFEHLTKLMDLYGFLKTNSKGED